jgi:hypothetical protein
VTLDGTNNPADGTTFIWGYWTGTDGATNGNDTSMHTTVTMDADKSVQACCPFTASPTTPCPAYP